MAEESGRPEIQKINPYILAALLLLSPALASADQELKGKVIWVTDGDTIDLLIAGNEKGNTGI